MKDNCECYPLSKTSMTLELDSFLPPICSKCKKIIGIPSKEEDRLVVMKRLEESFNKHANYLLKEFLEDDQQLPTRTPEPTKAENGLVRLDEKKVWGQLARVYTNPKHEEKELDADLIMDMAKSICCRFGTPSGLVPLDENKLLHMADDHAVLTLAVGSFIIEIVKIFGTPAKVSVEDIINTLNNIQYKENIGDLHYRSLNPNLVREITKAIKLLLDGNG